MVSGACFFKASDVDYVLQEPPRYLGSMLAFREDPLPSDEFTSQGGFSKGRVEETLELAEM